LPVFFHPGNNQTRVLEYLTHLLHLMISFIVVSLIYAYRIDPQRTGHLLKLGWRYVPRVFFLLYRLLEAHCFPEVPEILPYGKPFPVNQDLRGIVCRTPHVR
jgi:hypothetical protein